MAPLASSRTARLGSVRLLLGINPHGSAPEYNRLVPLSPSLRGHRGAGEPQPPRPFAGGSSVPGDEALEVQQLAGNRGGDFKLTKQRAALGNFLEASGNAAACVLFRPLSVPAVFEFHQETPLCEVPLLEVLVAIALNVSRPRCRPLLC